LGALVKPGRGIKRESAAAGKNKIVPIKKRKGDWSVVMPRLDAGSCPLRKDWYARSRGREKRGGEHSRGVQVKALENYLNKLTVRRPTEKLERDAIGGKKQIPTNEL